MADPSVPVGQILGARGDDGIRLGRSGDGWGKAIGKGCSSDSSDSPEKFDQSPQATRVASPEGRTWGTDAGPSPGARGGIGEEGAGEENGMFDGHARMATRKSDRAEVDFDRASKVVAPVSGGKIG